MESMRTKLAVLGLADIIKNIPSNSMQIAVSLKSMNDDCWKFQIIDIMNEIIQFGFYASERIVGDGVFFVKLIGLQLYAGNLLQKQKANQSVYNELFKELVDREEKDGKCILTYKSADGRLIKARFLIDKDIIADIVNEDRSYGEDYSKHVAVMNEWCNGYQEPLLAIVPDFEDI